VRVLIVEKPMELEEIGTLEQSKIADLMIVKGNLLGVIRILQDQSKLRVFKDGLEVTAQRQRHQFNSTRSDSPQFTPSPIPA
jgi:hypothetical protein